jgi:hypothetical protein
MTIVGMRVLPFNQNVTMCPKCHSFGDPRYAPVPMNGSRAADHDALRPVPGRMTADETDILCWPQCPEPEHLHWTCSRCGYGWLSVTADHKA